MRWSEDLRELVDVMNMVGMSWDLRSWILDVVRDDIMTFGRNILGVYQVAHTRSRRMTVAVNAWIGEDSGGRHSLGIAWWHQSVIA